MSSQPALSATKEDRLLIVSNRGPFQLELCGEENASRLIPASGGLATALSVAAAFCPTTWLSSSVAEDGFQPPRQTIETEDGQRSDYRFVTSDRQSYSLFYDTFSNQVLWLLQHELPWPADLTGEAIRHAWVNGYQRVNQDFAEAVIHEAEPGSYRAVMFQDYHLYLAPLFVRDALPALHLTQFVHIPWPPAEVWLRLHPSIVASICTGLLANDSVVFQTPESAEYFLETCCAVLAEARVDFNSRTIAGGRRVTRIRANPISIDPDELALASNSGQFRSYQAALQPRPGERMIVRVDRLDPSKNVPAGFEAYSRLLEDNPELHERVSFLAMLVPTRQAVPLYRDLEDRTMELIRRINARFGTTDWQPIRVFYENNRCQALAAMSLADVLLVNPVADGMNLVAKEGPLVSENDLVLVLSRKAGAFRELSRGALGVDPLDIEGTKNALLQALAMPASERRRRADALRDAIRAHDLHAWFEGLLEDVPSATRPGRSGSQFPVSLAGHSFNVKSAVDEGSRRSARPDERLDRSFNNSREKKVEATLARREA